MNRSVFSMAGALVGSVMLASAAQANLIVDGDFDSLSSSDLLNQNFTFGTNTEYGEWITAGTVTSNNQMWVIASPGEGGAGNYAMHENVGRGSGEKLAQFVDLGGTGLASGSELTFSFDYINQQSTNNSTLQAFVVGFFDGTTYSRFFTADATGNAGGGATVLGGGTLALTAGSFTNISFNITLDQNYDALGVVFLGSCFVPASQRPSTNCAGPRGVDNVVLEAAAAPEPGTLLLLGVGLAGLGLATRRRKA